jgi:hypothetical protein
MDRIITHRCLEADFVVAGGGMAGVCAAVAAARQARELAHQQLYYLPSGLRIPALAVA